MLWSSELMALTVRQELLSEPFMAHAAPVPTSAMMHAAVAGHTPADPQVAHEHVSPVARSARP